MKKLLLALLLYVPFGASAQFNNPSSTSIAVGVPQGRLTLQSGSPVQIADEVGVGTIYYDAYAGQVVPVYNGAQSIALPIASQEISLILDATHHVSGSAYDIFAFSSSGVLTLCSGPAWTSTSSRGTGAATTQIHNTVTGYLTNAVALATCYNNSVNQGTIAADQATYVGSFYATANGQTTQQFSAAPASGGSNAFLGLFNAYNRVLVTSRSGDSKASWVYASTTWQQEDASSANRVTWFDGLGVQSVSAFSMELGSVQASSGVSFNSTTATPIATGQGINMSATNNFSGLLGLNYAQAMEVAFGATTFLGSGTAPARQMDVLELQLND